jgi:hypothetical protein
MPWPWLRALLGAVGGGKSERPDRLQESKGGRQRPPVDYAERAVQEFPDPVDSGSRKKGAEGL